MRPEFREEAEWWLRQAESDFSALDILFHAGKYDLVCFLAQQVAEKALKAYLFLQGEEPPPTYSIARLCSVAARFDSSFQALRSEVKGLTPYYVDARYPNALEEIPALYFEARDAEEAMQLAQQTLHFVKERFPSPNSE